MSSPKKKTPGTLYTFSARHYFRIRNHREQFARDVVSPIKALGYDDKTAAHYAELIAKHPCQDHEGKTVVIEIDPDFHEVAHLDLKLFPKETIALGPNPPFPNTQRFPWADLERSRNDRKLQRRHPVADAKAECLGHAKSCPGCGCAAVDLAWFYFESPSGTWKDECGRAGWITVCDKCRQQVDFFLEVMS